MKFYLQKAVDFIDDHICMPLSLDMIADHIGFSKFYLNHMFSVYTGLSIMAYVRKKKLEYALDELKTDKRIIDIALEIGYSSERAFSRAILNAYGHSPNYFREKEVLKTRRLVIHDLSLTADEAQILANFPSNFEAVTQNMTVKRIRDMKKYLSDVSYEIMDKMTVLSGSMVGDEPEDAIIELMNRLAEAYDIKPNRAFGFDIPVEGNEDVTRLRGYEYWLVIDEPMCCKLSDSGASEFEFEGMNIKIKHIPAYRYATLRIEDPMSDPFERIGTGWRYLMSWLEAHEFKSSDFVRCDLANCLEEVKMVDGTMVMDIFVPVDIK
ncbi:AraC family transcriptional regulator [Fusibacter ferrireducens]|uniref:AraC family transcriptional regulator n=1 Tax=Fusibacter ferrireducens TaxID=2785058 RepID=A0ABR9ZSR3_9FIRM|nr:AraC family transcriptional regulator [Fusibacter ferrireducens]MBF4693506.1 AraC family transcriptional regulator [Fusibacter ferrireducens]